MSDEEITSSLSEITSSISSDCEVLRLNFSSQEEESNPPETSTDDQDEETTEHYTPPPSPPSRRKYHLRSLGKSRSGRAECSSDASQTSESGTMGYQVQQDKGKEKEPHCPPAPRKKAKGSRGPRESSAYLEGPYSMQCADCFGKFIDLCAFDAHDCPHSF